MVAMNEWKKKCVVFRGHEFANALYICAYPLPAAKGNNVSCLTFWTLNIFQADPPSILCAQNRRRLSGVCFPDLCAPYRNWSFSIIGNWGTKNMHSVRARRVSKAFQIGCRRVLRCRVCALSSTNRLIDSKLMQYPGVTHHRAFICSLGQRLPI